MYFHILFQKLFSYSVWQNAIGAQKNFSLSSHTLFFHLWIHMSLLILVLRYLLRSVIFKLYSLCQTLLEFCFHYFSCPIRFKLRELGSLRRERWGKLRLISIHKKSNPFHKNQNCSKYYLCIVDWIMENFFLTKKTQMF